MLSVSTIYVISEWTIRIVMVPIVSRRRLPSSGLAWLALIFAIPWLGLVMYLVLGADRLGQVRAKRRANAARALESVDRLALTTSHIERPPLTAEHQPLVNVSMNMGGLPILGGNRVELIADTDQLVDQLIADIDAAEHHVHLLFYIYRDDQTGRRVADALARAAGRGVACRVLVDEVGSWRLIGNIPHFLRGRDVAYHPALSVNPIRRRFSRIDLRNHRKLAVIDGRIAYTGSQNIVNADYGHRSLAWHDLMIRVTGPSVLHLQQVFIGDWHFETDILLDDPAYLPEPQAVGDMALQVIPTGPTYPTEAFQNLMVEAIHATRRRIILTTPYFVPDEPSLLALKLAVMRGAQVDLVVPSRQDHPIVAAAMRSYYPQLLEAGVNLHLFPNGLLHAKSITVDDAFAMVGSANFDVRSFFLNFELNVMLFGEQPAARLRFIQQYYIEQARPMTYKQWMSRPRYKTVLDDTARLLSPLL